VGILPERTLHLPQMTMTSGVENMPFYMGKRLLCWGSRSLLTALDGWVSAGPSYVR
jgi:hypothetical protein